MKNYYPFVLAGFFVASVSSSREALSPDVGNSASDSAEADAAAIVVEELPPLEQSIRFWVGPAWRRGSKISGTCRLERLRHLVPSSYSRSETYGSAPSLAQYVDRQYRDGYVRLDGGTLDPETDVYGITWYWGYESAGQYDGKSVSFALDAGGSTESFVASRAADIGFSDDLDALPGWEIGTALPVCSLSDVEFGMEASFRFFSDESSRFAGSSIIGRETSSSYSLVDVYDAPWPGFPDAPHQGQFDGPGYLLDARPSSRLSVAGPSSSTTWRAYSSGKASLEAFDLRIGPDFRWRPFSFFEVSASVQFALARASLDVSSESHVYAGSRLLISEGRSSSDDKWLPGAALGLSAGFILPRGWTLSATVARDWFNGRIKSSVGPFDVEAELGETTYSVGFGREF